MSKIISKFVSTLKALPHYNRKSCHCLVMTLLVKNEEKVLEHNLRFHKAMGVDKFIVTDNNSTDNTPTILQKYKEMGWIHTIIKEPGTNYMQKQWVDKMIMIAIKQLHADWIINADADEFWYSPVGNLKEILAQADGNVVHCPIRSMYPITNQHFTQWNKRVEFVPEQQKYDLSPYSIFERQRGKIAHRADGYIQIGMGNHKVTMFPKKITNTDIRIYHYNVADKETFMTKMINGGLQFKQHPKKSHGRHWRYFSNLHEKGKLEAEYDRVIGTHCINKLEKDGYLVYDDTICNVMKQIGQSDIL